MSVWVVNEWSSDQKKYERKQQLSLYRAVTWDCYFSLYIYIKIPEIVDEIEIEKVNIVTKKNITNINEVWMFYTISKLRVPIITAKVKSSMFWKFHGKSRKQNKTKNNKTLSPKTFQRKYLTLL